MRQAAAFLAVMLALAGCTAQPLSQWMPEKNVPTENADYGKDEAVFLARHPELAKRVGSKLTLMFPGAPRIELDNQDEEVCNKKRDPASCYEFYGVIGYWPERRMFLIDIYYYEGYESVLLDEHTTPINLINRPRFSPNKTSFAAYNEGCGMMPPEVEVWDATKQKPVRVYDGDIPDTSSEGLGIYRLVWETDNRIRVETYSCRFYNPEMKGDVEYLLQRQPDGAWTWTGH